MAAKKSLSSAGRKRLRHIYGNMKQRCYNSNAPKYKYYGAMGVSICDEWLNDYMAFERWCLDNGYREDASSRDCTLDRINVYGNYEPSNCRWTNGHVQSLNRRMLYEVGDLAIGNKVSDEIKVTIINIARVIKHYRAKNMMTISEFAEIIGMDAKSLYNKLHGKYPFMFDEVVKIVDICGCDLDCLLDKHLILSTN